MYTLTAILAWRIRTERGLTLPATADVIYDPPELKQLIQRQNECRDELEQIDQKIKQLADEQEEELLTAQKILGECPKICTCGCEKPTNSYRPKLMARDQELGEEILVIAGVRGVLETWDNYQQALRAGRDWWLCWA